jgi:hypothetical protein
MFQYPPVGNISWRQDAGAAAAKFFETQAAQVACLCFLPEWHMVSMQTIIYEAPFDAY